MQEYRYTRDNPWNNQCPKDFGYYIMADSVEHAREQIQEMFPHDDGFTIDLW